MLLGIDVGGTHTDAVVVDGPRIVAWTKTPTDHDNLLKTIRTAMESVLADVDSSQVRRVNLSTTLSTNAIVEGKIEDVGVLLAAGPGLDPEYYRTGAHYYPLPGSVDHRGTQITPLDEAALDEAVAACAKAGVRAYAVVGKFSTRNPEHERRMAQALTQSGQADCVTMGHTLSGILNFPRRIATAYFNSAVWRVYNDFAWAVEESARDFGLNAEINILKADGGTMPLGVSREKPVESILSGPAASVMGIVSLCDVREDAVILDIGGTTTDIAVFADGAPIIETEGMTVGSYPTLVQALRVTSIGIGGDSALHVSSDAVTVGPDRQGPALAVRPRDNGTPTLTDALNMLGICAYGDVAASREGIERLARQRDMQPERLARKAMAYAVERIAHAVNDMVDAINEKPVYTIYELLKGKSIHPGRAYAMGGPAEALRELLGAALGYEVRLPRHYPVANAIGAALTRTTLDVELFADTQKGRMYIPCLDVNREVPRTYNLDQAKADARSALLEHLRAQGVGVADDEPEITEAESFNMVDGSVTTGRNIRVKCQLRPGVDGPRPD
ncbi:N-methylhydantoinase A/oxoprolinase/acetone carboxylase beta subunit [Desulfobaculum xiamenense]|uniref:N-methylhydantoinase A/oxoprolinase/acetone carboxylase beta subunit n=1 Tax=Desulfobaculum xiamenense TaxID=995050 RepID=A0A846QS00_9BACT|nr:hydantoinase/oxoprolinase family protein [Desulfobaculum xiamenense]NJB67954.1 N-methylhydantoinase A/oxoprolinase/acetone carboxylase beta subunit [Desulfobaculum xiamenense]